MCALTHTSSTRTHDDDDDCDDDCGAAAIPTTHTPNRPPLLANRAQSHVELSIRNNGMPNAIAPLTVNTVQGKGGGHLHVPRLQ